MRAPLNRRVAVTGIGVVTPGGVGVVDFWSSLFRDMPPSIVRRVAQDTLNARRVMTHKSAKNSDINVRFAIVAADEALRDAGLLAGGALPDEASDVSMLADFIDRDRAAVSIGTGIGGIQTYSMQADVLREKGERFVSHRRRSSSHRTRNRRPRYRRGHRLKPRPGEPGWLREYASFVKVGCLPPFRPRSRRPGRF